MKKPDALRRAFFNCSIDAMLQSLENITKLPNILHVDKPFGLSSFDVIRILRKHYGKIKIGHAGTLDPRATGVMVLGIENGTKELDALTGLDKVYIADILLGKKTTTGDLEGEIVEEKKYLDYEKKDIEDVVISLQGEQNLPVSIFSALKKDGKPLYQYAREGEDVESPIKKMHIYSAIVLDIYEQQNYVFVRVRFSVSKGTYIRSLAEEIGNRLKIPATLASLRRISVGDFSIQDAYFLPLRWIQDFKNYKKDIVK